MVEDFIAMWSVLQPEPSRWQELTRHGVKVGPQNQLKARREPERGLFECLVKTGRGSTTPMSRSPHCRPRRRHARQTRRGALRKPCRLPRLKCTVHIGISTFFRIMTVAFVRHSRSQTITRSHVEGPPESGNHQAPHDMSRRLRAWTVRHEPDSRKLERE
jgi:hypothetical protein